MQGNTNANANTVIFVYLHVGFVCRVYDTIIGLTKPDHRRIVTAITKKDIHSWFLFLNFFNGGLHTR